MSQSVVQLLFCLKYLFSDGKSSRFIVEYGGMFNNERRQIMNTPEEKQVLKIPAVSIRVNRIAEEKKQRLRVAVYCRVSTEQETQASSYARQMTYYKEKIEESTKLENADEKSDKQYREIAGQINELKKKKSRLMRVIHLAKSYEQWMQDVDNYIKKTGILKRQFDK